ncbi:ARM repeat-containing protein [Perkinsela sp. CCAP 1560/4]|nr:ARM repeat-containing protein [Perkinsela sp. CCAP 1560/4]|eukprot:KNH09630.1 ARM repeat-containing protein [Perkinsela sp. CCAP 1560/4]
MQEEDRERKNTAGSDEDNWEDDFFSTHAERKSKKLKKTQPGLGYNDTTHVPPSYLDEEVTIEEVQEGEASAASKWDCTVGTVRDPYYMPTPGGYTFRDQTAADSTVIRESGFHDRNQYSSFTPTARHHGDDATAYDGTKRHSYQENRSRWDQTALNSRRRDEQRRSGRTADGVRLRSTEEIRREEKARAELKRLEIVFNERNGIIDYDALVKLIPDGYEMVARPEGMEPASHPNAPQVPEVSEAENASDKSDAKILKEAQESAEFGELVVQGQKGGGDESGGKASERIDVSDLGPELPKLSEEDYEFFGSLLKYKEVTDDELITKIVEWRKILAKKDGDSTSIGFDKAKNTGREKVHSQLLQYSEVLTKRFLLRIKNGASNERKSTFKYFHFIDQVKHPFLSPQFISLFHHRTLDLLLQRSSERGKHYLDEGQRHHLLKLVPKTLKYLANLPNAVVLELIDGNENDIQKSAGKRGSAVEPQTRDAMKAHEEDSNTENDVAITELTESDTEIFHRDVLSINKILQVASPLLLSSISKRLEKAEGKILVENLLKNIPGGAFLSFVKKNLFFEIEEKNERTKKMIAVLFGVFLQSAHGDDELSEFWSTIHDILYRESSVMDLLPASLGISQPRKFVSLRDGTSLRDFHLHQVGFLIIRLFCETVSAHLLLPYLPFLVQLLKPFFDVLQEKDETEKFQCYPLAASAAYAFTSLANIFGSFADPNVSKCFTTCLPFLSKLAVAYGSSFLSSNISSSMDIGKKRRRTMPFLRAISALLPHITEEQQQFQCIQFLSPFLFYELNDAKNLAIDAEMLHEARKLEEAFVGDTEETGDDKANSAEKIKLVSQNIIIALMKIIENCVRTDGCDATFLETKLFPSFLTMYWSKVNLAHFSGLTLHSADPEAKSGTDGSLSTMQYNFTTCRYLKCLTATTLAFFSVGRQKRLMNALFASAVQFFAPHFYDESTFYSAVSLHIVSGIAHVIGGRYSLVPNFLDAKNIKIDEVTAKSLLEGALHIYRNQYHSQSIYFFPPYLHLVTNYFLNFNFSLISSATFALATCILLFSSSTYMPKFLASVLGTILDGLRISPFAESTFSSAMVTFSQSTSAKFFVPVTNAIPARVHAAWLLALISPVVYCLSAVPLSGFLYSADSEIEAVYKNPYLSAFNEGAENNAMGHLEAIEGAIRTLPIVLVEKIKEETESTFLSILLYCTAAVFHHNSRVREACWGILRSSDQANASDSAMRFLHAKAPLTAPLPASLESLDASLISALMPVLKSVLTNRNSLVQYSTVLLVETVAKYLAIREAEGDLSLVSEVSTRAFQNGLPSPVVYNQICFAMLDLLQSPFRVLRSETSRCLSSLIASAASAPEIYSIFDFLKQTLPIAQHSGCALVLSSSSFCDPINLLQLLLDAFSSESRNMRNAACSCISSIAMSISYFVTPSAVEFHNFLYLPLVFLLNEFRTPVDIVQHCCLKTVSYIVCRLGARGSIRQEYVMRYDVVGGEGARTDAETTRLDRSMLHHYFPFIVQLLEAALISVEPSMRQLAADVIFQLNCALQTLASEGPVLNGARCLVQGSTDATQKSRVSVNAYSTEELCTHLLNHILPIFVDIAKSNTEESVKNRSGLSGEGKGVVVNAFLSFALTLGVGKLVSYVAPGLFHPSRSVRSGYWRLYNHLYVHHGDKLFATFPALWKNSIEYQVAQCDDSQGGVRMIAQRCPHPYGAKMLQMLI